MLRGLGIRNFKAMVSVGDPDPIRFEPITMLAGPNGAGKSTLLQAIDLLGWVVTSGIQGFLEAHGWEYADLPHLRSATSKFGVSAHLVLNGVEVAWNLTLGARRYPGIVHETVSAQGRVVMERRGRDMWRLDEDTGDKETVRQTLTSSWLSAVDREDAHRFPTLLSLAEWARGIRGYFFLDPVKLRTPNRGAADEIGIHGEFLAPFLARLRKSDRDAFKRLTDRVRAHYPRLVELHPVKSEFGWTHLEVTERWNGETARFNARQVSDGLLRLIAVAAMHELPVVPSLLLLDEIENGLHPRLLAGFLQMLREFVGERKGRLQVIATTHSPITLNYCETPREVLLVMRGSGGAVEIMSLEKAKNFPKLSAYFDLGELWYNVGEEKLRT
ncbi:MAG: AAA family ATPase [Deltaproteobacteria bacterium]|nr:AAA family ATPase [Deltaproteobacteria bacterium]